MRREMESESFNGTYKQLHRTNSVTRQCEMDNQRAVHSNKGASFIKILGRDFSKQLQLPEDFTMNMNGYVPHRFIIESGITKKCWRVEVEKDGDGRMYFRDGWDDFAKAHSLEVGNFLLFEYEEQSIFQVRIYSRNGCERTMFSDSTKGDERKPPKAIDDEDTEALEFEPVLVKCREPTPRRLAPRRYGTGIHKMRHAVPRSYKRTARVSVTENNMCFSVRIHHCKKHQFSQLTVPKAISRKMNLPSKKEVKLQDALGNSWNVKLAHRRDGRAILAQGWKEFLKDNKVSPRDKLKFEVVTEGMLQVLVMKSSTVVHERDDASESFNTDCKQDKPSSTCSPKDEAVENSKTSKSAPKDKEFGTPETSKKLVFCESGDSFSYMWRESCARSYLFMPVAIVRGQKLLKKDNVVLRDPEGKCWPVEVKKLSGNRAALAKGWVEFWRGCNLTHGDVLNFKFVSEHLIQVNIKEGNKPLHEPELKDAIICLGAMDTENAAITEPEEDISDEKLDAEIEPVEGFDASIEPEFEVIAGTQPGANNVIN